MVEQQPAPDTLWFISWVVANSPWICAGIVSAGVRFVYLFGKNEEPFRRSLSDAIICFSIVSVSSPVAARFGISEGGAMACGVLIGLLGTDAARDHVIMRVKAFLSGGKK